MTKPSRKLLLIVMLAFLAQGCCLFEVAGWDPIPCTKAKTSNEVKKEDENMKVK